MKISEKILTLRKRDGLSQEELAIKLGVSRQAIYKWESENSMPELDNIKLIAKLFNVSFDYLMDDEIESYETEKKEPEFREGFYTGTPFTMSFASIDNGLDENETQERNRSKDVFDSMREMAKQAVVNAGATDYFFPDLQSATVVYYNSNNYTVGFYYGGKIQLVCPIENIVRMEMKPKDYETEITVYVKDSPTTVRECKLWFSFSRSINRVQDPWVKGCEIYTTGLSTTIQRHLNAVRVAMNSFLVRLEVNTLQAGHALEKGPLPAIDLDLIDKINTACTAKYSEQIAKTAELVKIANDKHKTKLIVGWSVFAAGIFSVILSFIIGNLIPFFIGIFILLVDGTFALSYEKLPAAIALGIMTLALAVMIIGAIIPIPTMTLIGLGVAAVSLIVFIILALI